MKNLTLQRARIAFHRSSSQKIYLREKEIEYIKRFLVSKKSILNISGNPGTGKTFVVQNTIDSKKSTYLNFFSDSRILSKVKASKSTCFVIDEFDKYEVEKPKECQRLLSYVLEHGKKLIKISNNLRAKDDTLFFKPYSPQEIEEIVASKLRNEVGEDILEPYKIKLLSKRVSTGDVRQVYEQCIEMIDKEEIENTRNNKIVPNIHKSIIDELVESMLSGEKSDVFSKYLDKCKELSIPALGRSDFSCLYDLLE